MNGNVYPPMGGSRLVAGLAAGILRRRLELGLSQERLAGELGLHRNTIWRLENGEVDPTLSIVNRIYLRLGTSALLLSETGPQPVVDTPLPLERFPTDQCILEEIGRAVDARRRSVDISQEWLAETAGLHRNTVGKIERGEVDCEISSLFRLYAALGVRSVDRRSGTLVLA